MHGSLRSLLAALRFYSGRLTGGDAADATRLQVSSLQALGTTGAALTPPRSQARLARLCNVLSAAARRAPRPTLAQLHAEGKWFDLAILARVFDDALEHHNVCMRADGRTRENAVYLQALVIAAFAFRFLGAQRPRVLAAMSIRRDRCVDDQCGQLSCPGSYVADGTVHIQHDKTERSHGPRDLPCPQLLADLVEDWLAWGRGMLLETPTDALFIDPTTGGALSRRRMSSYFCPVMQLLSANDSLIISFTAVRGGGISVAPPWALTCAPRAAAAAPRIC